jgi:hypothetical protein
MLILLDAQPHPNKFRNWVRLLHFQLWHSWMRCRSSSTPNLKWSTHVLRCIGFSVSCCGFSVRHAKIHLLHEAHYSAFPFLCELPLRRRVLVMRGCLFFSVYSNVCPWRPMKPLDLTAINMDPWMHLQPHIWNTCGVLMLRGCQPDYQWLYDLDPTIHEGGYQCQHWTISCIRDSLLFSSCLAVCFW